MPKIRSKKTQNDPYSFSDLLIGSIFFILTGIMPLIVRLAIRPVPPEMIELYLVPQRADMFSYWRGVLLIIASLVILFHFASDFITNGKDISFIKEFIKRPYITAYLVFLFFLLLSALMSPFKYTSFIGGPERYEGVFTHLAYFVIFLTALYYVRDVKFTKPVIWGLVFSAVIMGLIGLGQFLGKDFFLTDLGNIIITGVPNSISLDSYTAYGTMYNPNTLGLYGAMVSPLLLICGFTYGGSKILRICMVAGGFLMIISIAASYSLGGIVGAAVAAAVIAITYVTNRIYTKKLPSIIIIIVTAACLLAGALLIYFIPALQREFTDLINKYKQTVNMERFEPVYDFNFDGPALIITRTQCEPFSITHTDDNWMIVRDANGNEIIPSIVNHLHDDEGAAAYDVYHYEIDGRSYTITREAEYFIFMGMFFTVMDGAIAPMQLTGMPIDMRVPIASIGFEGYENWGSGRGYIWSRSLPLAFGNIFIGSGPDTFNNVFPNDDVIGKLRFLNDPYLVVDKAHSLYLQTTINTGLLSMLALMFLYGFYIVQTFLILVKTQDADRQLYGLRLGIMAAVSAYLVSSITTDSTITTTGVCMILLGLGYGVNKITTHQKTS